MMEWLDHKAYTEAIKSFFQQDNYGKPIKKKIDAIEEKSRAFQKRIDFLLHERVMSIGTEVKDGRRENQVANRTLIALLVGFVKDAECKTVDALERRQLTLKQGLRARFFSGCKDLSRTSISFLVQCSNILSRTLSLR
jgi:hypothetical protein